MRRTTRWTVWTVAVLLGLPLFLVVLVLVAANTESGRDLIERAVPKLTGGKVTLTGLAGQFPNALRIARIEVRDHAGPWLVIDHLTLDWSPSRLLAKVAEIDRLEAGHIAVERLPAPSSAPSSGSSTVSLPISVTMRALHVDRLDLAPPVAGTAAAVAINGAAHLASIEQGDVNLSVRRLDQAGAYAVQGRANPAGLDAHLTAQEPAHGLMSSMARLPDLGALSVDASLEGPWSAIRTQLALVAGPLHAAAQGTLDLEHRATDLTVTASAPAMRPRPDLAWQAVALDAQVHGPFTRSAARGTLRIDALSAAGTAIHRIAVELQGDTGQVHLRAELDGVTIPGPRPDLLQAAPLTLQADARLDLPDRPVTFTVQHPLIVAEGKLEAAGNVQGMVALNLPDLAPFAAAGGMDVHGHTALTLRAAMQGDTTQLDVDGTLGITGGMAPLPALVGDAAKIGVSVARRGQDITLSRLQLDGRTLTLSATGGFAANVADLSWKVALSDLAVVTPAVSGRVSAQGHLGGPQDDLAVTADLSGEVATKGMPRGPIAAKLGVRGLPRAPSGQLTARGVLDRSPLDLALAVRRSEEGVLHVAIDRADWKSAHAEGALTLPKGAVLPVGKVDLRMTRLEDLRPMVSRPLSGSVIATLETTEQGGRQQAHLQLDARDAGLAGTASVGHAALAMTVADPTMHPVTEGRLTLDGISTGTMIGSARLELAGPGEALHLRLSATAQNPAGAETQMTSAAILNARAKNVAVSALQARWKGETLRLLSPVRIGFADGITLDRLRLGLRQAVLEVAGRVTPTLDLSAALRNVPGDLASLFAPGLAADGTLRADAKLTGPPARPAGTVKVEATGLRLRTGPGRTLPPANLTATANLAGESARIDSRLTAGSTRLTLSGQAPINRSGPLDLRAGGSASLAMLDPFLAASGRRVRGQMTLNAGIAGTLAAPRITGTVQLAHGEVQDFAQGAHITGLTALLEAEGETIRIARLEGRAGPGTITASGNVGALAPGMPIDLTITARNARPLSSDRLTVNLNADLTLHGQAARQLTAAGTIHINRAEIRIPEHTPASIAVLEVRTPGARPPPPPAPGPNIALNLTFNARREIFVRGRGLDAELGGTVRVHGTAANPQPDGSFEMLRGELSLAGHTLAFSKGVVSFNGGSLTDPSLNFVASTTSGDVTATLTIGGTAEKPKITLSSVPDLPQDEVLAHLLFGHGAATLSPFELAEIASAVASLTGVTSGVGNPLESIRKGLGLSRLSVGGGGGSPTLEAGRYVAPGVYVGTKQGISGTGTQATVQVDITKGLKLESTVGTGSPSGTSSGANSIGLMYQFEY